jgi:hypothetical protein
MSDTFVWMAVFVILSALVNAAGIFAIVKYKKMGEKTKTYFMCFAAGVLISTPLMRPCPRRCKKTLMRDLWRRGFSVYGLFQ